MTAQNSGEETEIWGKSSEDELSIIFVSVGLSFRQSQQIFSFVTQNIGCQRLFVLKQSFGCNISIMNFCPNKEGMSKESNQLVFFNKEEIEYLVSKGDLLKAAECLRKFAKTYNPTYVNDVIALKCSISTLEREYRLGKLGIQKFLKGKSKLAEGLLYIMDELFESGESFSVIND